MRPSPLFLFREKSLRLAIQMKPATRDYHPAKFTKSAGPAGARGPKGIKIPKDATELEARLGGRVVKLTNLKKPFWPALGITKGDLLQY